MPIDEFDPSNVFQFKGKTYVTHGSSYSISNTGELVGGNIPETAFVEILCGLPGKHRWVVESYINHGERKEMIEYVMRNAELPVDGNHLTVVFTEKGEEAVGLVGHITSGITEVR